MLLRGRVTGALSRRRVLSIATDLLTSPCPELARTAKYHSTKLQPIRKSWDEGMALFLLHYSHSRSTSRTVTCYSWTLYG